MTDKKQEELMDQLIESFERTTGKTLLEIIHGCPVESTATIRRRLAGYIIQSSLSHDTSFTIEVDVSIMLSLLSEIYINRCEKKAN